MPILDFSINFPTQAEIDDFCLSMDFKEGEQQEFIQGWIAGKIKRTIEDYRLEKISKQEYLKVKEAQDKAAENIKLAEQENKDLVIE